MPSVAVFFGGRSVEHDVSVITGIQVVNALEGRHQPVPVYVDRGGAWYTSAAIGSLETHRAGTWAQEGQPCRLELGMRRLVVSERRRGGRTRERTIPIDVAFPAIHGSFGEDGCLQGLLEMAGVPYTGSGVTASAVAMHKPTAKAVLRMAGLPVVEHSVLSRAAWASREPELAGDLLHRHGGDVIVKPVALGSSIGVVRCTAPDTLAESVELVLSLDREAMVEPYVSDAIEVNCSVLGRWDGEARTSVCEQPLATSEVLSFEDKYLRQGKQGAAGSGGGKSGSGHTDRLIPAPVDESTTARVQALAEGAFRALGCAGVVRVDCFVQGGGEQVLVNELNTIPGSFSFYLWEPSGVPFAELCDELLRIAEAEGAAGGETIRSFESALLTPPT